MESPLMSRLPHQASTKRAICNPKQYKKTNFKNIVDFEDVTGHYRPKCYHNFCSGDFDDGHFGYQVIRTRVPPRSALYVCTQVR